MAIDVKCPECREPMRFSDRVAGKTVRCPNCDAEVQLPEEPVKGPEKPAQRVPAPRKPPPKLAVAEPLDETPYEPVEEPVEDEPEVPQISLAPAVATGQSPARASKTPAATHKTLFTPPILAGVAVVLVLGLLIGIVLSLSGSKPSEQPRQVAQADQPKPKTSALEDDLLLLDEHGKPIRKPKHESGENKTGQGQGETPEEKPAEKPETKPVPKEPPAETPAKPAPTDPVAEKPEPPEPAPEPAKPEPTPEPEDPKNEMPPVPPATEPPSTEPEPEPPPGPPPEPAPQPPVPPDQEHTKVDVIKVQPTPKPAEKPAPADPKAKPSGKDKSSGKSKTRPKRPPEEDQAKDEVVAGPPDPNCAVCRGSGKAPFSPFRPYLYVEGGPAPKPELILPSRYCPKCQKGKDDKDCLDAEVARLKTGGEKHLAWEQKTTWQLVLVQTHLVSIHAQLPPPKAQEVGMAVEALAKHLEDLTKSLELCVTRPDDYEMVIVWEKPNYLQFLKLMEPEWAGQAGNNWGLLPELAGSTIGPTSFFRQMEKGSPPPAHMAVSMTAKQQLMRATGGRVPAWLREGFSAYGENAVLGKNLVHSIDYQIQNHQLNPDWSVEMRRLLAMNQLRPWARMFTLELRDYQAQDYVTSFSMTAFLLRSDPQKFLHLVRAIRDGKDGPTALAEAYGKPVEQLQADWLKWVVAPR